MNENCVVGTLMFWFVLTCVYSESRTSLVRGSHALPVRRCAKQTRREHSWDRWPEFIKGIFHSTESHAQYLAGGVTWKHGWPGLRCLALVSKWWEIALCITCCFFFYCHYHYYCKSPLLLYFILFSIIILFLSQHTSFTLNLLPIPPGWGREGVSSCTVLIFQLGLKPALTIWLNEFTSEEIFFLQILMNYDSV